MFWDCGRKRTTHGEHANFKQKVEPVPQEQKTARSLISDICICIFDQHELISVCSCQMWIFFPIMKPACFFLGLFFAFHYKCSEGCQFTVHWPDAWRDVLWASQPESFVHALFDCKTRNNKNQIIRRSICQGDRESGLVSQASNEAEWQMEEWVWWAAEPLQEASTGDVRSCKQKHLLHVCFHLSDLLWLHCWELDYLFEPGAVVCRLTFVCFFIFKITDTSEF